MLESEEFEELLVYADFDSTVDITSFSSAHLLGVESSNPIIQIDDTFFKGKYEIPVGTFMFFQEDPAPECEDPVFHKLPEKSLKYLCKSSKYLKMEQAYVAPKDGSAPSTSEKPENDIKPITFKSVESALAKFREECIKHGDGDETLSTNDDEVITQERGETAMHLDLTDIQHDSRNEELM